MRTAILRLVTGAVLTGALAVAPRAAADPTAADVLLARQLGNEGVELASKGECEPAIVKLQRAESLHHAPTLLVRIGECQLKLGRLVDALSTLDRAAREQLGPTPPRAFVTAQQRAAALVQEIRPKLGTLRVDANGSREGVIFRLDGDDLNAAAFGLERPIDPGSHVIEATTPDGKRIRREVTVRPGALEAVVLELPAAPAPVVLGPDAPAPAQNDRSSGKSRTMIGWGLTGGGAAALVTGAVFAGITLSSKSDLDASCANKACPASARSDYDSARTTATVSGIALGVGVIATAAGVYLLLTSKSQESGARAALLPALVSGGRVSF